MPVPNYHVLMLPALKAFADGSKRSVSEARARIAKAEGLTQQDVSEKLASGRQTVFVNRVAWALFGIERAGLLKRVSRGVYQLTEEGKELLDQKPVSIDNSVLNKYPAFVKWRMDIEKKNQKKVRSSQTVQSQPQDKESRKTLEETLARITGELGAMLETEVLNRVHNMEPAFLEQVVIDLLTAVGYGGSNASMGRVTGKSGNSGIDGTIWEDAFGLDEVYVQAKQCENGHIVGEGDLQNFGGALDVVGTTKGVFVTTTEFTSAAKDYVGKSQKRIVLINGKELAHLMVRHGVGVRMQARHEIKRIDKNYFDQGALKV